MRRGAGEDEGESGRARGRVRARARTSPRVRMRRGARGGAGEEGRGRRRGMAWLGLGGLGWAGRAAAAARLGWSGGGSARGRAWRAGASRSGLRGCGGERVREIRPETVKWEGTLPRARSGRLSANLPPLPRAPRSGSRQSFFFQISFEIFN